VINVQKRKRGEVRKMRAPHILNQGSRDGGGERRYDGLLNPKLGDEDRKIMPVMPEEGEGGDGIGGRGH